eukprot:m.208010 g.208010  ORF g.208010 m.208010 type:complete len:564 (+) comp18954_c0_seq1:343-2034(+)
MTSKWRLQCCVFASCWFIMLASMFSFAPIHSAVDALYERRNIRRYGIGIRSYPTSTENVRIIDPYDSIYAERQNPQEMLKQKRMLSHRPMRLDNADSNELRKHNKIQPTESNAIAGAIADSNVRADEGVGAHSSHIEKSANWKLFEQKLELMRAHQADKRISNHDESETEESVDLNDDECSRIMHNNTLREICAKRARQRQIDELLQVEFVPGSAQDVAVTNCVQRYGTKPTQRDMCKKVIAVEHLYPEKSPPQLMLGAIPLEDPLDGQDLIVVKIQSRIASRAPDTVFSYVKEIALDERGIFLSCMKLPTRESLFCVHRRDAINGVVMRESDMQLFDADTFEPLSEHVNSFVSAEDPRIVHLGDDVYIQDNFQDDVVLHEVDVIGNVPRITGATISLRLQGKNLIPLMWEGTLRVLDLAQNMLITMIKVGQKDSYYPIHARFLRPIGEELLKGMHRGGSNMFTDNGQMCGFGHSTIHTPSDDTENPFVSHVPFKWCLDAKVTMITYSKVTGNFEQNIVDPCSVWTHNGTMYVSTAASELPWIGLEAAEQHYNSSIWTVSVDV